MADLGGPMKLICVMTALMLLHSSIAMAAPAAADGPQVTGTREERASAAAGYYAQGDFVRAALGFEGLHTDHPQERDYLFNAAASRHGAGHYAHAVAYTREYLAISGLPAADRQEAEAQLKEAQSNVGTVKVTVAVEPGGEGPWTLIARHVARESGDIRPDLPFTAAAGAPVDLALDPGVWTIRAAGAGYVAAEQRVEVSKGAASAISLSLAPAPEEVGPAGTPTAPQTKDIPPVVVRRSLLGFGIAGGLAAVAGISVLGVGAAGVKSAGDCDETNAGQCVAELRDGLMLRDLGVAALGSGVGLLVGGMTWKIRDAKARRTGWIVEAGVGAAALIAGMVLIPMTMRSFNGANDTGSIRDWGTHYGDNKALVGHAVSSAVFGLGLGTLVSAGTSLGLQRRHLGKNVQVSGMAGRGQFGLTLTGRF